MFSTLSHGYAECSTSSHGYAECSTSSHGYAECRVRSIGFPNHIELLTQTTAVDCISV